MSHRDQCVAPFHETSHYSFDCNATSFGYAKLTYVILYYKCLILTLDMYYLYNNTIHKVHYFLFKPRPREVKTFKSN